MSRRGRILVAAGVVAAFVPALVTVAAAAYVLHRADPAPNPVSLVTQHPTLPATGWRPIGGIDATDPELCPLGRSAQAAWSIGGDPFAEPGAFETVCAYRFEPVARLVYASQSLYSVSGWPGFESWSDAPRVPRAIGLLEPQAEEWEIGCGLGDPDGPCRAWVFRARYGRVLTVLEFQDSVGLPGAGSRFETMRKFVESVDEDIAAKLRSRRSRSGYRPSAR
jgi:hypothetical protein